MSAIPSSHGSATHEAGSSSSAVQPPKPSGSPNDTINGTTSTASKPSHIALIGGGIGGLCLAIGLHSRSIPFHIYESAPAFAEIGAGVAFGPNAQRAMALISPDVKAGYDRRATRNAWVEKEGVYFDWRLGEDVPGTEGGGKGEKLPAGTYLGCTRGEGGASSIHRAHFLDELVRLVPGECVTFGRRVEDVRDHGEQGVEIVFTDGSTARAAGVVGCDGIKSKVRSVLLGPGSEATFTGKFAYRGLIPMDKAAAALGDELARNAQMYLGRGGHILTFPIEKGMTMNVVAFHTKTTQGGRWTEREWVLPMKHEDLWRDFGHWGQNVRSLLPLMQKPDVWAIFHSPETETYAKGRICLMGGLKAPFLFARVFFMGAGPQTPGPRCARSNWLDFGRTEQGYYFERSEARGFGGLPP
jgi:salicylate hydroxylase